MNHSFINKYAAEVESYHQGGPQPMAGILVSIKLMLESETMRASGKRCAIRHALDECAHAILSYSHSRSYLPRRLWILFSCLLFAQCVTGDPEQPWTTLRPSEYIELSYQVSSEEVQGYIKQILPGPLTSQFLNGSPMACRLRESFYSASEISMRSSGISGPLMTMEQEQAPPQRHTGRSPRDAPGHREGG